MLNVAHFVRWTRPDSAMSRWVSANAEIAGRTRPTADFEDLMECFGTMKIDFSLLDSSIIEALAKGPLKLDDLLAVAAVRDQALRLNIRRAGVSPSYSADTTINERLQVLRRASQVAYDRPTSRWEVLRVISS